MAGVSGMPCMEAVALAAVLEGARHFIAPVVALVLGADRQCRLELVALRLGIGGEGERLGRREYVGALDVRRRHSDGVARDDGICVDDVLPDVRRVDEVVVSAGVDLRLLTRVGREDCDLVASGEAPRDRVAHRIVIARIGVWCPHQCDAISAVALRDGGHHRSARGTGDTCIAAGDRTHSACGTGSGTIRDDGEVERLAIVVLGDCIAEAVRLAVLVLTVSSLELGDCGDALADLDCGAVVGGVDAVALDTRHLVPGDRDPGAVLTLRSVDDGRRCEQGAIAHRASLPFQSIVADGPDPVGVVLAFFERVVVISEAGAGGTLAESLPGCARSHLLSRLHIELGPLELVVVGTFDGVPGDDDAVRVMGLAGHDPAWCKAAEDFLRLDDDILATGNDTSGHQAEVARGQKEEQRKEWKELPHSGITSTSVAGIGSLWTPSTLTTYVPALLSTLTL